MTLIEQLRAKLKAAREKAAAIDALATTEDRALTEAEETEFNAAMSEFDSINAQLDRALRLETSSVALEASAGRQTLRRNGEDPDAEISGGDDLADGDPTHGFRDYGDFCQAVVRYTVNAGEIDERLRIDAAAATTFANEGVGSDGGFLVPPLHGQRIYELSLEQSPILPMTDNIPVSGNSITFPKDETTPWGSNGVRARWAAEGSAGTADKPVVGTTNLRLHKLISLVPMSDEIIEDVSALGAYVAGKTAKSIGWKSNDAFINGTGAGQPLGILNSGALVSVAKESGQAADTFLVDNVAKMYARMLPGGFANSVWMINNDVFPELITMVLNNQPIFTAPGGIPSAPNGMLLGRPIIISQHCLTVGDKGDVYFADWKEYVTITKASGVVTATSIHLYFDAAQTAFRATFRVDGRPWLDASVTPANGSNNLSAFVSLDARA